MDQNFKVAICEQMEDPCSQGLVKRQVVKVVTPGTVADLEHLDDKRNNFWYQCSKFKIITDSQRWIL